MSRSSIRARTTSVISRRCSDAVRGETVTHILLTHTHRDHSPAAAAVKAATGAPTYGEGPHRASRPLHIGEINPLDAAATWTSGPTIGSATATWSRGRAGRWKRSRRPGHCANHMAYALKETNSLFFGDHVMGWSTSIVAPPDGADERLHGLALQAREA